MEEWGGGLTPRKVQVCSWIKGCLDSRGGQVYCRRQYAMGQCHLPRSAMCLVSSGPGSVWMGLGAPHSTIRGVVIRGLLLGSISHTQVGSGLALSGG